MTTTPASNLKPPSFPIKMAGVVLLIVIVGLLYKWHDDLAVLCAVLGVAIGWLVGTLISPYGSEAKQFETFGKVVSAFLTGFLVSKIDSIFTLLSRDDYHNLITQPMVIRRLLITVTSALLSMMVVFISRQYYYQSPKKSSES
jgi:hypothetical protein